MLTTTDQLCNRLTMVMVGGAAHTITRVWTVNNRVEKQTKKGKSIRFQVFQKTATCIRNPVAIVSCRAELQVCFPFGFHWKGTCQFDPLLSDFEKKLKKSQSWVMDLPLTTRQASANMFKEMAVQLVLRCNTWYFYVIIAQNIFGSLQQLHISVLCENNQA